MRHTEQWTQFLKVSGMLRSTAWAGLFLLVGLGPVSCGTGSSSESTTSTEGEGEGLTGEGEGEGLAEGEGEGAPEPEGAPEGEGQVEGEGEGVAEGEGEGVGEGEGESEGALEGEGEGADPVAARLQASIQPRRVLYPQGGRVTLKAMLYDGQGGELGEAPDVRWTVEPAAAATVEGARYIFQQEGPVKFTGCSTPPGAAGELCGSTEALVDSAPPSLTILQPRPAQVIDGRVEPELVIRGTATDTHGEVRVWVNGQEVALGPAGEFESRLQPKFGLNQISVVADDGLQPDSTEQEFFVLWAPDFLPVSDNETAVAAGARFWLDQLFWDDGLPLAEAADLAAGIEVTDLASMVELILSHADLMQFVPDPLVDSELLQLRITEARPAQAEARIAAVADGLDLFLRIGEARVTTVGGMQYQGFQYDLGGTIRASLAGNVHLKFHRAGPDQPIRLELSHLGLGIESMQGEFNDARVSALFELGTNLFHQTVESTLETMITELVLEQVPGLLERAVVLMEDELQGFEFPLDLGLGAPVTLGFDFIIGQIQPVPGEGLLLQLDLRVRAQSRADVQALCPEVPMTRRLGAASPAPGDVAASVAVRLDAVNALLHRLWAAGVLALDVSDLVPEQLKLVASKITVNAAFPPVVVPVEPEQGVNGLLEIQAGEVQLALDHPAGTDIFALTLREAVTLRLTNDTLSLALEAEPRVLVRLVQAAGAQPVLPPDALEDLTLSFIWPMVTEQIGPGLSYPIPTLPLTQVAEIAPDLADLTFHLQVAGDNALTTRSHHLMAEGGFVGELAGQ